MQNWHKTEEKRKTMHTILSNQWTLLGKENQNLQLGISSLKAITIHIFLLQRLRTLIKLIFKKKNKGKESYCSQGTKHYL